MLAILLLFACFHASVEENMETEVESSMANYTPDEFKRDLNLFLQNLTVSGWNRNDNGLDLRVTRGLGTKGYNKMRVSVVTQTYSIFDDFEFQYKDKFQYRWHQNYLYSSLIDVEPGKDNHLTIAGNSINIRIPEQNKGTRGLLFADPCIMYNSCCCKNADNWHNLDKGTDFINEVMKDDQMDWFYILGDNFYDLDSTISKTWFQTLTIAAKSKILGMVGGNHDMWINGSPGSGRSSDQFGIGIMQWYAMDVAASIDNDVYDFSINPDVTHDYQGTPNAANNNIWWHITGNVGMLGYNGAYTWDSLSQYFDKACEYFTKEEPAWVFLYGHWDGENLGCAHDMDAQSVFKKLSSYGNSCYGLRNKIKFFDGHKHCNYKINDDGFLIGGNGMYDGACSQGEFGYLYVKTTDEGHLQIWYYEMINGWTNNWSSIVSCIQTNGIDGCTGHAHLWFDGGSGPDPPTPTPDPSTCVGKDQDPWATGAELPCCSNLKKCLKRWPGHSSDSYLCVDCSTDGCTQEGPCQPCTAKDQDPWATHSEVACCANLMTCLKQWDGSTYSYQCVDCSTRDCSEKGECIPSDKEKEETEAKLNLDSTKPNARLIGEKQEFE